MGRNKTLVTGASGQVGLALSQLMPDGIFLTRSDLDIGDGDAVLKAVDSFRPKVIINAAAFTSVDLAESDPDSAFRVNGEGVMHLAEATKEHDCLLVQVSSDYVFDGEKVGYYNEEDFPNPRSVYGKSKLEGEAAAATTEHIIVRTSWVFGDGKNFVRTVVEASAGRASLDVVDDQVGRPTYAPDLATGIVKLIDLNARGIFHLTGSGVPSSWADVAEVALAAANRGSNVTRVTTEQYYAGRSEVFAPRPANSSLDCQKAEALGVSLRPWEIAVREYVRRIP